MVAVLLMMVPAGGVAARAAPASNIDRHSNPSSAPKAKPAARRRAARGLVWQLVDRRSKCCFLIGRGDHSPSALLLSFRNALASQRAGEKAAMESLSDCLEFMAA